MMNIDSERKKEQRRIALELAEAFEDLLIRAVNKCPDEWDGFEIRQLASDLLAENFKMPLSGQRKKDYENERLVRNL